MKGPIYLAARYSRRQEMLEHADALAALGYKVTARWIKGNHQISDDQLGDSEAAARLGGQYATEDLQDIMAANLCIFFNEEPGTTDSRGGRHVELGFTVALGKPCWIVGPLENVFHCLPAVRPFEHWPAALAALS